MSCEHDIEGKWENPEPGLYGITGFRCTKCDETWAPGEAPLSPPKPGVTYADVDDLFRHQFRMTQDEANVFDYGTNAPEISSQITPEASR